MAVQVLHGNEHASLRLDICLLALYLPLHLAVTHCTVYAVAWPESPGLHQHHVIPLNSGPCPEVFDCN